MNTRWITMATVLFFLGIIQGSRGDEQKAIRVGMIGLDTSHAPAFTKILNQKNAKPELAGIRVVAAYPGGSPDIPASANRVGNYTKELRGLGVEIVGSIEELLPRVDVVLLESVDGRPHWEQAKLVLQARKPLFIDKPVAGSLADAIAIFTLANATRTPCFSSSSLRFAPGTQALLNNEKMGRILGCDAYSPCMLEPHHPDLFWYGVHGVETLFTLMGTGCVTVTRVHSAGTDVVVGQWQDGRIGTFRGIREGAGGYGATVFSAKSVVQTGKYEGYEPLVVAIAQFFRDGKPPVSAAETLEIFAFMEAADESKRQGGKPVTVESVLTKARAVAKEKLAKR